MKAFLDSSAFAKRFIEEDGSEDVESLCFRASELGLSVICVPEIVSALNRRLRENLLTRAQYDVAKKQLLVINMSPGTSATSAKSWRPSYTSPAKPWKSSSTSSPTTHPFSLSPASAAARAAADLAKPKYLIADS